MSDLSVNTGHRASQRRRLIFTLSALGVLAALIASCEITQGGFSWSDAPLHAMDGVFLHDLLKAWPSGSWKAWAEQYYLEHQCLGIGVYYPPLFAGVEAVLFAMFGVSVAVARLAVVLFVIGAVWLIYLLGRDLYGETAGVASALLTLVSSAGVAWSRQVMLEWPAVFWIALSFWAYARLYRRPHGAWGILMAAGCLGAYLTKQTAGFVIGAIVLHAIWSRQWSLLKRPAFWGPFAVMIGLVSAYAAATSGLNALAPMLVAGDPPWQHLVSPCHWSWYALRLPNMLGWTVMMTIAAACVALSLQRLHSSGAGMQPPCSERQASNPRPPLMLLPVLWLAAWWLISTAIAAKEERYFFFAIPAVTLVAGWALGETTCSGLRPAMWTARAGWLFLAAGVIMALRTPAMRLADTRPTAAFLAERHDADLVLVDAVRDGQLIFDLRIMQGTSPHHPASRPNGSRLIALRASKLLYSRAARTRYAYAQHVSSPADIVRILNQFGIRYIVLEDRLPTAGTQARDEDRSWDTPPRLMLRKLVTDTARFKRVFTQPLRCGDPAWNEVNLVTYRYRNAPPRQSDTIRLPIPAMGKEIELNLSR